ncbi:MAG: ATP-dependent zinc protease, partial [Burkholderiales bacterium]|nr:ATP-dependent zinc protease [Burkholderiales bacterium]
YDLPLVRHSRIKKRASEGNKTEKHHSRPVVNMEIYFDGELHTIMVNLIDRSHFSTPMLLGRSALEKVGAIVDSTVKNTLLTKNGDY